MPHAAQQLRRSWSTKVAVYGLLWGMQWTRCTVMHCIRLGLLGHANDEGASLLGTL